MFINKSPKAPNRIYNFQITNFSGGLNNASSQLNDNESPDMLNMMFSDKTLLEKRNGIHTTHTKPYTNPIKWVDTFEPSTADKEMTVVATDKQFIVDDVVIHTASKACEIRGVEFKNAYWFVDCDGVYMYAKVDGTNTTHFKTTGTDPKALRVYKVVLPASGFTPLDKDTNQKPYTEGVTRVDFAKQTILYEPCKLQMDNENYEITVVPNNPKYITVRNNRLYVSGTDKEDDTIFISDNSNPVYFPSKHSLTANTNYDSITSLFTYDDSVIIGKQHEIHVVTGNFVTGSDPFKIKKLNTPTGIANQNSICVVGSDVCFVGSDGKVYALSNVRTTDKYLATVDISKKIDIAKYPISASKAIGELRKCSADFYEDNMYINIGDKVLVYNLLNNAWSLLKFHEPIAYITSLRGKGIIFCGSKNRMYEFKKNDYCDSVDNVAKHPYTTYWKSKQFDMGNRHNHKHFREFNLLLDVYRSVRSDISFITLIDYKQVKKYYTVEDDVPKWGESKWGTDVFTSLRLESPKRMPIYIRGRSIQFEIFSGLKPDVTIDTYAELTRQLPFINKVVYCKENKNYYMYRTDPIDNKNKWLTIDQSFFFQPMKIFDVTGEYEIITNAWLQN